MRMFRQSANQNHYPVFGSEWRHWTALTAGRFRRCCEEKTTQSNWMNFRLHLVLFRDGSSVEVFGWNGLKVFVNNALYSDFYAKYRRIEPEQAPLIQESQLMGDVCTYKILICSW